MIIDLQEQCNIAIKKIEKTENRQDLEDAEDIFNALLNVDENSAIIYFYLGTCYLKKKYFVLAEKLFRMALEKDQNLFCVWNNLGYALRENKRFDEARVAFKKSIELKPDDSDSWMNLGGMYVATGDPDKAIELANKALELNKDNAHAIWNRSLAYLEKGDYVRGWADYEAGVRSKDRNQRFYHGKDNTPKWNGEKDKTIVVYGEQGIGDEIMFASILPDVIKDAKVIFDAHPRLYKIFRESFPNIYVYGTRKDNELAWPLFHKIDAAISIASLGKFYRTKPEDFPGKPYLKTNPILYQKMKEKLNELGPKLKVGISWKGGTKKTNSNPRHIKLEKWLPLLKSIDADWISLQYKLEAQEEINDFEKVSGIKIHHFQEEIDDYDLTAALVSNLDFIISVPQSVVHLAGALGIPTIQLTPKNALWQMGVYGHDMPWYSCVKNIWQDESREWESVIQKAKEEICNLYQMSIAS